MGLGAYRFVLAAAVIVEHLAEGTPYVSHTGMFAVFGFYVLSGYLITRVLNGVYDFAFFPFWSNRFLRLYPLYFLFLGIGVVLVLGTEGAAAFFPAVWKSRPDLRDWIGLLTIFPMGINPMGWSFRPVPSAWSVGVELLNYAALYVAVARGPKIAFAMFIGAAALHVFLFWRGHDLAARYFPFHAALLPFAMGALIHFWQRRRQTGLSPPCALMLCAPAALICILAGLAGGAQPTKQFEFLFYLNLVCQCVAIAALASMPQTPLPRLDKFLGDLSYPMFLCHWLVGYVLAMLFFPQQWRGLDITAATFVASAGVAYVACRVQDKMIEPWRARIRVGAATDRRSNLSSNALRPIEH